MFHSQVWKKAEKARESGFRHECCHHEREIQGVNSTEPMVNKGRLGIKEGEPENFLLFFPISPGLMRGSVGGTSYQGPG